MKDETPNRYPLEVKIERSASVKCNARPRVVSEVKVNIDGFNSTYAAEQPKRELQVQG